MSKIDELQAFAIWMTGCGYDFTQHEYYLKNRHLLGEDLTNKPQLIEAKVVEILLKHSSRGMDRYLSEYNYIIVAKEIIQQETEDLITLSDNLDKTIKGQETEEKSGVCLCNPFKEQNGINGCCTECGLPIS